MIDYYFKDAPSAPVSMEIMDATGKVVRTLSSEAVSRQVTQAAAPSDNPDEEAPVGRRGGGPPVRLAKNAGGNRVTWDYNDDGGLMLPPGTYSVKLASGNWSATQPLTLKIDPRLADLKVSAADLREQYDHNVKMRAMVAEVNRVVNTVTQERTRLRDMGSAGADSLAKIDAIANKLLDQPVRYGRPGLRTQITYLAGMDTRADQKVGQDAFTRYAELRKELDVIEAQIKSLGPKA